ncbi:unnamed protein product [Paramecium sonneborni]|uniref:Transmembrane protein n=1 Tax=Paramecium sonneborni TaxID=65129 RepID=A0A8S1LKA1_9CILI|nr:unnamed protein product [Paramecium sonneborni]
MNKFFEMMEKIDMFGVQLTLLTKNKESNFQSRVGGSISVCLGSLSFAYFLFVLVQWINNEIPPNINTKQKTTGYAQFKWSEPLIYISLEDFTSSVDPFRIENNIITPLLFTLKNGQIYDKPIALFSEELLPNSIILNNGTLILNNGNKQNENKEEMQEYLLVFASCSDIYLKDRGYCADDNSILEYMSQYHGFLDITIILNQFNYKNNELENFKKTYYQAFNPQKSIYSQIMLKQQETIIDDGILFSNENNYQFLNNYEIINQEVDNNFISNVIQLISKNNAYNMNISSSFLFRIDNISIVEGVTMPKLGAILADIGSIVQLIFFLQYIAFYYNNILLENGLLHDIVTMYYPEFKNLKPNIFNQYKINEQINKFDIPIHTLQQKYSNLFKGAKDKCRLDNILYEISRIQFILEQQFGNSILQYSHQLGKKITKDTFEQVCESLQESNYLVVKPINEIKEEIKFPYDEPLGILIKQF